MKTKIRLLSAWGLLLSLVLGLFGQPVKNVQAAHEQVLFTGRFDFTDPTKPVFSHVSSSIKANFNGTGISATFRGVGGTSYLYVIIDGNSNPENRNIITISNNKTKTYTLASGLLAGNHTVELVKENQYDTKVAFHGFAVTGGTLLAKPTPVLAT